MNKTDKSEDQTSSKESKIEQAKSETSETKEELSLNTLISMIRTTMTEQGILRLEITQDDVLADLVKTVSLNL